MSCPCENKHSAPGESFVCPCDRFAHPPVLRIGAGLQDLPRQIAGFPEFRRAMLYALRQKAPLRDWQATGRDDLGLMLLEMWAYLCDSLAFYDKVIAQETYLRTALRAPSLRRLVALTGYLPRPAVAATVQLAALADGRLPVTLPAGTAFRSSSPAQVFELDEKTVIHPLTNNWKIRAPKIAQLQTENPDFLLVQLRADIQPDTWLLLTDRNDGEQTQAARVKEISPYTAADGHKYTKIVFHQHLILKAQTYYRDLRLLAPSSAAARWTLDDPNSIDGADFIKLESVNRQIEPGDYVLLEHRKENASWFKVNEISDVIPNASLPYPTTRLKFDVPILSRMSAFITAHDILDKGAFRIRYGMTLAGVLVEESKTALSPHDPLELEGTPEAPSGGAAPSRFFLNDKNLRGIHLGATLSWEEGKLYPNDKPGWTTDLTLPVEVFGNLISASRGESVRNEILGSGNANVPNHTFKLKKKPLTYLPAPTATGDYGIASTLRVYVDGVKWREVSSFYGQNPEDEVYIVRQNDEGDSLVTFGDGVRGRRLPTGRDNVVAYYRYGAGQATPQAGSINQIETPVPGLGSIRNPVRASGGADAEGPERLRRNAPRSALILGRAVSMPDMEAVVLSIPGVRAAQIAWAWNGQTQSAGVSIWYIGDGDLEKTVKSRLEQVTDPGVAFTATPAQPAPAQLALALRLDPRYREPEVLTAVRAALLHPDTGLLSSQNIGIGKPLYRSKIYEAVLAVAGTSAVAHISWNGQTFDQYAQKPGAGRYFDFESDLGQVLLTVKS
jgi:hypothetical protein